MKRVLNLFLGLFPSSRVKNFMLNRLGHRIHSSASVAPNFIVGSTRLELAPNSRIGPFNVLRNLVVLQLGEGAEIGQWNWLSAAPLLIEARHSPSSGRVTVGAESAITSRHYFDASGGIEIDEFVTVAGARSVFMSHGIDVTDAVLDSAPITIGRYAMVGGSCSFLLGAHVPEYSVVAMGSVVIAGLTEGRSLYAGVPARLKKPVDGKYFERTSGPVAPRRVRG